MAKMKNPNILDILFTPHLTIEEFNFQALCAPPLYSMLTFEDVEQLRLIATSIRYNANIDKKYQLIDRIMRNRGFRKFAGGTNRIVYACEENSNILLKIAIDRVGMKDNPAEYINQWTLQPYVCKCFEVSQCGTVGIFERLIPITHLEEFANIANDVFDIVVYKWLGKYVLDDIGTKYFMNWAIRKGFGPCLIDFPYLYKLDSNKLYCNKELQLGTGIICGGEIDYDAGFNDLICTRCGKKYIANQLEDNKLENQIIIRGGIAMKVGFYNEKGELIVAGMSSDHMGVKKISKLIKSTNSTIKVSIVEVDVDTTPKDPFKNLIPEIKSVLRKENTDTENDVKETTDDSKTETNDEEVKEEVPLDFNGDDEEEKTHAEESNNAELTDEEKKMVEDEITLSISGTIPQLLENISDKMEESNNKDEGDINIHAAVFRALAEEVTKQVDSKIINKLSTTDIESDVENPGVVLKTMGDVLKDIPDEKIIEGLDKIEEEYILPNIGIGSKFIDNKHNKGKSKTSGKFKKQFDDEYDEEETTSRSKRKKGGSKPSKIDNF